MAEQEPTPITLESYDLASAERLLCARALQQMGSIVHAAKVLGITRHALRRRTRPQASR